VEGHAQPTAQAFLQFGGRPKEPEERQEARGSAADLVRRRLVRRRLVRRRLVRRRLVRRRRFVEGHAQPTALSGLGDTQRNRRADWHREEKERLDTCGKRAFRLPFPTNLKRVNLRQKGKTNLSHDGLNPAHVPCWWVNNPTLSLGCGRKARKSRHRRIKKQRRCERLAATSQLSLW